MGEDVKATNTTAKARPAREGAHLKAVPAPPPAGEVFERTVRLPVSADAAFAWHERPGALERLTPPWSPVKVEERSGGIRAGGKVVLRIPVGPFSRRWVAEHVEYERGRLFRDVQVEGPFTTWDHTHLFEPIDANTSELRDRVRYALPLGPLGQALGGGLVRRMLASMFAYRHRVTEDDLAAHARYSSAPLRFLVSGASGLVGSALVPFLTTGGHAVTKLGRRESDGVAWDPDAGQIGALPEVDAVVHLAGENIGGARWTAEVKNRIRESRTKGTRLLCEALARAERKPAVLISASAVGYYGDRGQRIVDENDGSGDGFLAGVCRDWEEATQAASDAGIRVVHLRFGVVLTAAGGALAKLLPPFKLGLGGRLGDGRQMMSWIAMDDLVTAILHAATTDGLAGPVNATAPGAVSNAELTATLAEILHRPALLPLPAFAARAALGEMADEMLLTGAHVAPARLTASDFRFRFPTLAAALRHTLGREGGNAP